VQKAYEIEKNMKMEFEDRSIDMSIIEELKKRRLQ